MATLDELMGWRDALQRARYAGVRTVEFNTGGGGGRSVTYRSDAELRAALAEVERQIAAATGTGPVALIRTTSCKGT